MNSPVTAAPSSTVSLRGSVTSTSRVIGGRRSLVLHDDESGKYYHFGPEESVVVSMFQDSIGVAKIEHEMKASGLEWTTEDLKAFLSLLCKSGLIVIASETPEPSSAVAPISDASLTWLRKTMASLSWVLTQRLTLGNGDRLASFLLPALSPLFGRAGLIAWCVTVAFAFWTAFECWDDIAYQCIQMFAPAAWPLLISLGVGLKVVHEIGHAIAAKRHGVRVGTFGVSLFMFTPIANVDLTNAWKLKKRWARIQIALGGVYLEGWVAALATFWFSWLEDGIPKHLAAQIMMIAGPATWLVNANPLMRLDGYFVLSDALEIPNLRMHGRKQWASMLENWLLGKPLQTSLLTGWRRYAATLHTAASFAFQLMWMTGLVIAVSYWAGIVGVVLACIAILVWCVLPLLAWWLKHWNAQPAGALSLNESRRRMLTLASTAGLLLFSILSARNPFSRGVPIVVQYRDEQVGRAAADGFVTAVMVQEGQVVRKGDVLVQVTDEELLLRKREMSDELSMNLAKYQQLQNNGKLSEAEAAHATAKQLRTSIQELNQAIASLRIVAMRSGVVVSEFPEKLLGKYAARGEVLVRVADPKSKELLVGISETDLFAYQNAVRRGKPLAARIRGGQRLVVEAMEAQPRFKNSVPHPAMAANVGGDIPVVSEPDSSEGFKSAVPIGEAVASISPSQSTDIRAGQRGTLYLDDDQTIYARVKDLIVGPQ